MTSSGCASALVVGDPGWRLSRFEERLDDWIDLESPPDDVRAAVTAWILTRVDDPFQGARRELGFPNLWTAVVPGSIHRPQSVVVCSYWVSVGDRTVVCNQVATLGHPV
jgi:hypothetical protein